MARNVQIPEPGARFRRRSDLGRAAIAQIVGVRDDGHGIPHVTFELNLLSPNGARLSADRRTLSYDRFRADFPELAG